MQRLRWLALGVVGLSLPLMAVAGLLQAHNRETSLIEVAPMMVTFASFTLVGGLVAYRRPTNPVGWSFMMISFFATLTGFASQYGLLLGQSESFETVSVRFWAWLANWSWWVSVSLTPTFPLLLFPNGKPPSSRWVWAVYLAGSTVVVGGVGFALDQGQIELGGDGPLVPGLFDLRWLNPISDVLSALAFPLLLLAAAVSVVSVVVRFRRARGEERQQLKWIAYAGFLMGLFVFLGAVLEAVGNNDLIFALSVTPVPVAAAVAILRYRLYDIDVIINRTLVYGVLTAALLASYLLIIVALSRLLDPVTQDSDVAVAASTLAVAALFGPLRRRIQGFIDRRFYRAKYNAEQSLNEFTRRLRDEVDIQLVRSDVLMVVSGTVQPSHASVWLNMGKRQS